MGILGKHGVSQTTPENIPLGAGTIHKNFKWNTEEQQWEGAIIGATSGGNSLEIKGEVIDIELDGALVAVKGLAVKQGGEATMENSFAELNDDVIKMGTLFKSQESDVIGYTLYVDKADISDNDYVENYAFVGKTANDKKDIIVIFENALCTSGFKLEGKNKENSVIKLTMKCYANNEGNLDKLPIKIYYPTNVVV